MKKKWKKILAIYCTAVIILTLSGGYVSADEMQGDISTYDIFEEDPPEAIEQFKEDNNSEVSGSAFEESENAAGNITEETVMSEEIAITEDEIITPEISESAEEELVGVSNPYPTTQNVDGDAYYEIPCTYFAWQQVYDNTGIALPSWGNAVNWWQGAKNAGYATGSSPKSGAIAVWSGDYYGHVAYVTSGSGNTFTVNEGGRTDLDHTSSHGVKYGYTLTNAVGGSRPYDTGKTLLGFIYPTGSPTPTVTFTPWGNDTETYIRETDASIGMEINVSGGTCTSTGMYLYDSNGSYLAQGRNSDYTYPRVYFMINAECGYTLSPGTTYKYKFYAVVNGQTYWSNEYSFKTNGTSPYEGKEMDEGYSRVLPDGDYEIVSAVDISYYLDIAGADMPAVSGSNVALWRKGGHLPACDVWNLTYNDDGFYTILQKNTEMSLDVQGSDKMSGANIMVHNSHGGSNQKWAISHFGGNSGYRIQAKNSGWSLDITGASLEEGTNIEQYVGNDSNAQRWLFIPYEPEKTIADGRYVLVSALNPNLVLDVAGDTGNIANGTNVQVWNDGADSRYYSFDVKYLEQGYYRLTHAASGKSLEVNASSTDYGANIQLNSSGDQNNQKWAIIRLGDGYMLVSRCSGYVMDVANGKTTDGTNVRQVYYNGSPATEWRFVPAEYKVTYNANGGSGAPSVQTKYYKKALTLSSVKPTLSGKVFKGWATSSSATSPNYQPGASYTTDKNLTLYAVWETQTKKISDCTVTLSATSYTYNGKAKKPTVTVKNGATALTSGTDYTVVYSNNTNAGTATVTITGKGSYTGTISKTFTIKQAAPKLTFASTAVSKTTLDGSFTNTLTKTTDGTVTFKSSDTSVATVNSTSGAVTIKGIGTTTITASATAGKNYKAGSASYTLTVVDGRTDISKCTITLSATSYTYNGKAKKPTVTVKNGTVTLTSGTDYTVAYSNNTNAGTATVKITGKGNYTGTVSKTFTIKQAAPKLTFASATVSKKVGDDAFVNELTKTTDGAVSFSSSNTKVATVNSTSGIVTIRGGGTATITAAAAAGKNYKAGTAKYTLTVADNRIDISTGTAKTKQKVYNYTGKVRHPAMILVVNSVTLVKDTDYTLSYKNDIAVGTATVTATGIGKYKGTISCDYMIKDIIPVYRLFNRKTGEHFYTASTSERQQYLNAGYWNAEGIAWYAPKESSEPIYRLSNPNNGNEHHYTKSKSEKDWLVGLGWHYDCIAWYSDTDKVIPIYRHYHPIQRTGNHHYTTSKGESDHIVKYEGWNYEGIAFYVSQAGG